MSEPEIAHLLRRLFAAYRTRFHEDAPRDPPPVPVLAQKRLDVVSVNGGRALHFFFSEPSRGPPGSGATRLHAVTLWPPETAGQKAVARSRRDAHREMVRTVARIRGEVYVHFVLYPEDGGLMESMGAVGARLAKREIRRHMGASLAPEVPGSSVRDPGDAHDARFWGEELDPAP